jgi:hypothetical protein
MLKKRYEYVVEDVRGNAFRAVLRDRFGIVFVVDETLVDHGYMKNRCDMAGLTKFLNEVGILPEHYSIKTVDIPPA